MILARFCASEGSSKILKGAVFFLYTLQHASYSLLRPIQESFELFDGLSFVFKGIKNKHRPFVQGAKNANIKIDARRAFDGAPT